MDKINLILLLLTSAMMFAKSDEIASSSTEVPTTAINNQNMKNYTSASSLTAAEETSTSSSAMSSAIPASENQLKVSNLITTTPAAAAEQTSTQEAVTTTNAEVTAEIVSSSHVDLITETTLHSEQDMESTVVSFGIRSFTVEVSKGDEKVSTEPTNPSTVGITQTAPTESSVSEKSLDTTSAATTTGTTGSSPHSSSLLKSNLNILFSDEGNDDSNNGDDTETTVLLSSHENEIANEIQIDKKLDNGLYRIKIGEITTDEFANGLNFNEPLGDKLHHGQQSKVNIDDFFPSKIEDFRPIIEISNEKMLKEKDALHNEQVVLREEIILNEEPVESKSGTRINTSNVGTTNIEIELIDDTTDGPSRDEITTRVEEIVTEAPRQEFIPVRSKKFDPKSNTQGPSRMHDFAMTKFNQKKINLTQNLEVNGKPEYSTTKFYNSKELYNEILHKTSKGASTVAPKTTIMPNIVREKLLSTNKVPIDTSRLAVTTSEPLATTVTSTTPQRPYTTHPRVISRLEEKLNQLDCDIQNLSADSQVWRGNETHELNLPIKTPEDCSSGTDCLPMIISWEGSVDIQSGDVLIVGIDDKLLISSQKRNKSEDEIIHRNTASVYQVTRLGHEHCDITEGELLDITPLVVDGRKLITLYDKDLTEGINLLIVVSELWDQQCVRLRVNVKSDNCGENAECSGKGICFSNASMESFFCECCSGFAGQHCEEIDACTPSPCTNNGICVDLSQGHEGNSYQCLCPYGYTGKNCQYEADPCNPSQCLNGGTCISNTTHFRNANSTFPFRCECPPSFTGPLCQHNLNECESSPCVHGICVDQEDGFRCFCQPGFSGDLCNFEYNECDSNPCLNGGQCIDHIGGFSCQCTKGYQGKRCHIKIDFCANNPCEDGYRCVDHGDEYSCVCPGSNDHNVPDCHDVPRTLCKTNPCKNAGTCWTSNESFYCACHPGYTGKFCEDDFVIDTVVSSSELLSDVADGNVIAWGELKDVQQEDATSSDIHNAYVAAGILASALLVLAVVVTICHCKVNGSYRRFSLNQRHLIPYFLRRGGNKNCQDDHNKHWLSGKNSSFFEENHINLKNNQQPPPHSSHRATSNLFNRPLQMSLENDMYYTVDFSESSSQQSPLIQ